MVADVDELGTCGARVTVPAVVPETVMVNPGKSARLEKVFEVEVCVTVEPFLVYWRVAVADPVPESTIEVTVNG
jgi:hypothetical protein